jgi:regulator of replication initiation timing
MSVATIEFHELVCLLETHPRWRAELRQVLFPQEFLDLPGAVKELVEAQRRTEEALIRLTERMERGFAEAATARAEAASDRQRIWETMEKGFAEAAEDRRRIWKGIERLTDQMSTMTKDVGSLKGTAKELWYQNRAASIFGLLLTRGHDAANHVADRLYEAQKQGVISQSERRDALAADLFWKGRRRENGADVVLVVEVSWLVEKHDVERAERRAKILRRVGIQALPVAAGEVWGEGAESSARLFGVVIFEDGQPDWTSWQKALEDIEAIY